MNPVVYRFFDADGRLLYIGSTTNFVTRIVGHQYRAPFFRDIASVTLDHYETREGAAGAERLAISTEHPLHNKQHQSHSDYVPTPEVQAVLDKIDERNRKSGAFR